MSLLWNDNLNVGHPLIDAQHRELFAAFDAFVLACEEKRGLAHLAELHAFLDHYVRTHFAAEEALMEENGYQAVDAHRRQHHLFIERIEALRNDLQKSGPSVRVLVMTTKALIYWLTEHIREVDSRLTEVLSHSHPD